MPINIWAIIIIIYYTYAAIMRNVREYIVLSILDGLTHVLKWRREKKIEMKLTSTLAAA